MDNQASDTAGTLSRDLDWNLLRTFMVIVQERGITRAANRLGLRQPTVTAALKRLERQLGWTLVQRGRGQFRVTQAGELLYREAVEIYGNITRLEVLLGSASEPVAGHVTITMASHVECAYLDEVLARFHQEHPAATFTIEIATSAAVVQNVLQRDASLGVCLVHNKNPALEYTFMFREHFGFYCGPRHRLFGRRGLRLADLRDETFVSFKTDRLTDALRPVALLRAREQLAERIIGMSSHLEEVRRMIVAGLGYGTLPVHVAERDVRQGLLWRLPPYEDPPAVDIFLVTNPRSHLNPAEQAFLEVLRARIAGASPSERVVP